MMGGFLSSPQHVTCEQAQATVSRQHTAKALQFGRPSVLIPAFKRPAFDEEGAIATAQVGPFDKLSIKGLTTFAPGKPLAVAGTRPDGSTYEFTVNQTFNENQIHWFKAGSALNAMGAANKA